MDVRGTPINLLAQAKELPPRAALIKLGLDGSTSRQSAGTALDATRQRLLQCLAHTDGAGQGAARAASSASDLCDLIRSTVTVGIGAVRGTQRNREIFFAAVLAGDPLGARTLAGAGVPEAICGALTRGGESRPPPMSRAHITRWRHHMGISSVA